MEEGEEVQETEMDMTCRYSLQVVVVDVAVDSTSSSSSLDPMEVQKDFFR